MELGLLCHYRGKLLRELKVLPIDELLQEILMNQKVMTQLGLRKTSKNGN